MNSCIFTGKTIYSGKDAASFTSKASFNSKKFMPSRIEDITLDGGWLCLDFTNTVSGRKPVAGEDYLKTWDDYVLWVRRLAVLPEAEFAIWQKMPPGDMSEVRALREAIFDLFDHYAKTGTIHPAQLDTLNGFLHEVYMYTCIKMTDEGLQRGIFKKTYLEKPLWLIALSAESLLLSERLARVKACDNCGWLFLDTSKNGTRRWCNMYTCGSQSKSKAYYHRKKAEPAKP